MSMRDFIKKRPAASALLVLAAFATASCGRGPSSTGPQPTNTNSQETISGEEALIRVNAQAIRALKAAYQGDVGEASLTGLLNISTSQSMRGDKKLAAASVLLTLNQIATGQFYNNYSPVDQGVILYCVLFNSGTLFQSGLQNTETALQGPLRQSHRELHEAARIAYIRRIQTMDASLESLEPVLQGLNAMPCPVVFTKVLGPSR